jgi:plasmid stabilization system protein ParE
MYPLVRDEYLAAQGIRWTAVKKYMMFYRVNETEERITVIRFLYGRRNWKYILNSNTVDLR